MAFLAVSIAARDTTAALAELQRAAAAADLAELRLDLMQEFDLPRLLASRPLPLIVTCRPAREGGAWQGSEAERLAVLRTAAALGADYVDLEWDCAAEAAMLERSRTRLILSRHDFAGMPANLPAMAADLWAAGADVVKVVGAARRLADCAPALQLLDAATRPTIAIAMGACGLVTRLLAFRYPHAFLSFAAPDPPGAGAAVAAAATAPGQITLGAMRALYRVRAIGQGARLIGLLAPDANTSPLIEEGNRWLAQTGMDAVLLPLQVAADEQPEQAIDVLRAFSLIMHWPQE